MRRSACHPSAARLVRFDHAVHGLVAGQDAAGVADGGGYTDQSHLHRDVAAFTGLTPATVITEPFLAVDEIAWGWPKARDSAVGLITAVHEVRMTEQSRQPPCA
jgi:hypothetical protein